MDQSSLWHLFDRLPQGTTRIRCPFCADNRRPAHRFEKTLSVTVEGMSALYNCHHCQEHGRSSLDHDRRETIDNRYREVALPKHNQRGLTEAHVEYLNSRGISSQTATEAGVFSLDYYIRDVGQVTCLAFPYPTATKFRATHVKGFSCQGSPNNLFLADRVVSGTPLIITEGEIDALSFMEAGVPNAVSVPNGSPGAVAGTGKINPKDDNKFKYIWNSASLFSASKKIVIATDNDEPGEALAEELARRIGKYRCYRLSWPLGVKDANEALVRLGAEALRDLVESAQPWPVAGLYETSQYEAKVFELFTKGEGRGMSTGISALDPYYTVVPGQFTIVTGIPGNGKSEFVDHVITQMAEVHDWRIAICSFENPPSGHIVKLLEKHRGLPFYQNGSNRMKEADVRSGLSWVADHFYWMEQADGNASSVDDIIERAKVAVMRYGVRGVVIDPYNYIDKPRDMAETEFVSETLTKIKQFAVGHDVHVWFVAHPTKLRRDESGRTPAPGGYEISGSAAWFAKADCGVTVHKGSNDCETEIHVWKIRFKWVGKTGMVMLAYDRTNGRYSDGRQATLSLKPDNAATGEGGAHLRLWYTDKDDEGETPAH